MEDARRKSSRAEDDQAEAAARGRTSSSTRKTTRKGRRRRRLSCGKDRDERTMILRTPLFSAAVRAALGTHPWRCRVAGHVTPRMTNFHAQLGERVRTRDALRVASSFFSDGLEKFKAGELELALSLFEQTLAVNQKYLQPEASSMASCFQSIAAVHDKLGNLDQAVTYYHRARLSLSSLTVPKDERGVRSRRKRREQLKQVQQQLEAMPRTHEPKVGDG